MLYTNIGNKHHLRVASVSVVAFPVLARFVLALVLVLFAARAGKTRRASALVRVAHAHALCAVATGLRRAVVLFLAMFACKK